MTLDRGRTHSIARRFGAAGFMMFACCGCTQTGSGPFPSNSTTLHAEVGEADQLVEVDRRGETDYYDAMQSMDYYNWMGE